MTIKWLTNTIYTAPSTIDNVGIYSSIPILEGDSIYQVIGQWVRGAFSEEFAKAGPNWIGVSKEVWLDPDPLNPMTFMNHSCEPNAIVTNGLQVVALRAINAHEEIVMDYSTTEIDPYWSMPCKCKTASCRHTILPYQFLPAELRLLYRDVMLESLVEGIESEKVPVPNRAARYGS